MSNHVYILDGSAADMSSYPKKVQHILRDDPFAAAPSWATCIRQNIKLGFCWCDSGTRRFTCIDVKNEMSLVDSGDDIRTSTFGDVVATRLTRND